MIESVESYSFRPADLRASTRRPGISAFMRIRNGADFLERTILSHAGFFDEIVAVYNQCTDATPDILARLQQQIGPKLRIYHYVDRVFSPGSEGHASTPGDAPRSMVNYSNFALAQTTTRTVTKLDDDHLAIPAAIGAVVDQIREQGSCGKRMLSFSGINLIREPGGRLAIPKSDPLSGSGDIGFFDVTDATVFTHDRRFERVPRPKGARTFCGFLYWHLKYLKTGMGFANYDLHENPNSRFAERKRRMESKLETLGLPELRATNRAGVLAHVAALFSEKKRIARDRAREIGVAFPDASVEEALLRTVDRQFLQGIA